MASAVQRFSVFIGRPPGSGGLEFQDISVIQRGVRFFVAIDVSGFVGSLEKTRQLLQVSHLDVLRIVGLVRWTPRLYMYACQIRPASLRHRRGWVMASDDSSCSMHSSSRAKAIGFTAAPSPPRCQTGGKHNIARINALYRPVSLVENSSIDPGRQCIPPAPNWGLKQVQIGLILYLPVPDLGQPLERPAVPARRSLEE